MFRIYFYKFLIDFWTIVPVLVPFYKSHGLQATQLLTIQTAFSVSQLIFEIPSGYLSDVIGRKKTLILAAVCMVAGIGIYILSSSFWYFILAEAVLGLAGALRSGTDSAILYDHLKSIRDEHKYAKCEGNAEFWSRTGTAVSSVGGGILGAYVTLQLPFYINFLSAFVMLIVGISLKEPPREKRPSGNALKNIIDVAYTSVTKKPLFGTMLQMGIMFSTGVTAIWGYFLLYRQIDLPLFWHGVFFAIMQLTSAFAARHGAQLEKEAGKKPTALVLFLPGILFLIAGSSVNIFIILPMVLFHAALWGMSTPLLLEKIQKQTTSDVRATTLSVGSMIGRIIVISIGPAFGWIVDRWSIGAAFMCMGLFFYCAHVPLLLLSSNSEHANEPDQVISG
jgi:MFS family permease